jgi:hypothetical protein
MKLLLKPIFVSIMSLCALNLSAQWTGPTSGLLNTVNNVRITKEGGLSGTPESPLPPLFEAKLVNGGASDYLFHIAYSGKIGIGTANPGASLHIANGGNFKMTRSNGNSICSIDDLGRFILTTDGVNNQYRGLFLNNGTTDFLKITQGELTYSSVFKIDANVNIASGDLIIKDNVGDIQFRAYANGLVRAREVRVNLSSIAPDYVFDKSYKLLSLPEVEQFISKYKHLPNVASAQEMTNEGSINVNDMQFKLLEKVEELTLYLIQLNKENQELKERVSIIENQK